METIGSFLKSEREKKNKSLKDISGATKISKTMLEAIEEDRKESLPPPSYTKGFLKIYAKELELDPDEVLGMYETRLREKKWEPQKEFKRTEAAFPTKNYKYITIGVIPILFFIYYFFYSNKEPEVENTEHSIMSETVTTAPVLLQGTALPAPKDVIAEEETTGEQMVIAVTKIDSVVARDAQEQSKEFTVRFDARELAWFKITVDDKEPFEIMLRAGQSYRKTAGRSMKVRIGNAGGLSLFFNDIPIGVPGEHGKPLNLQFPEAAEGL